MTISQLERIQAEAPGQLSFFIVKKDRSDLDHSHELFHNGSCSIDADANARNR